MPALSVSAGYVVTASCSLSAARRHHSRTSHPVLAVPCPMVRQVIQVRGVVRDVGPWGESGKHSNWTSNETSCQTRRRVALWFTDLMNYGRGLRYSKLHSYGMTPPNANRQPRRGQYVLWKGWPNQLTAFSLRSRKSSTIHCKKKKKKLDFLFEHVGTCVLVS